MDARKIIGPTQWPRPKLPKLFTRMRHPFRLVFIDDETLDEVALFRLNKHTVFAAVSMVAVVTVVLTVLVLFYSPLKYYIPGYGNSADRRAVLRLRQKTDSLAEALRVQDLFVRNMQQAVNGEYTGTPADTAMLSEKAVEAAGRESLLQGP